MVRGKALEVRMSVRRFPLRSTAYGGAWLLALLTTLAAVQSVAGDSDGDIKEEGNRVPGSAVANPPYVPLASSSQQWPSKGGATLYTFVHITDPHIGRDPADARAFRRVVAIVNDLQTRPRFVLITGDLTDHFMVHEEVEEFEAIRAQLKMPSHVVVGNHDVSFDPTPARMKKSDATWEPTPYRFDEGPLAFIGVNSQLYNARRRTSAANGAARQQWKKLVGLVRDARNHDRRVVLFMHIPSVPILFENRIKRAWQPKWLLRYRKMIRQYDVEAELAGHFHKDETYFVGETAILVAPPISTKYERRASLRIFRVTPTGLAFRQLYVDRDMDSFSYTFDLHAIGGAQYRKWVGELPPRLLADLWLRRYAGSPTPALVPSLARRYRAFQILPYEHQPPDGLTLRFKR